MGSQPSRTAPFPLPTRITERKPMILLPILAVITVAGIVDEVAHRYRNAVIRQALGAPVRATRARRWGVES